LQPSCICDDISIHYVGGGSTLTSLQRNSAVKAPRAWTHGLDEIRLPTEKNGFDHAALSELFENVPLAIAVTLGPDHRYAFANKLFRSALSATGDLSGKPLREALGERYTPETQALRQYVLESGKPCEIAGMPCGPTPDQEESFWDIRFLPVRNAEDRVSGILTIGVDVTERVLANREAERQAREAEISGKRLALAVEATELGLWDWDAIEDKIYWSDRQREIFGIAKDQPLTHDLWKSAIHPEDHDWVVEKVSSLTHPASSGKLRIEYRIVRPDGEVRWISSRGGMLYEAIDGELKATRLLGTILDITERRRNEEIRQLLAQELNHRVKNLFAMAASMVTLTARVARTPKEMALALRGRLEALARSHELIRPAIVGSEITASATSMVDILQTVLAPHLESYSDQDPPTRVLIEGPFIPISAKSATALTLVLHELATNASKYGALSVHDGQLRVGYRQDKEKLVLSWQERNGPAITNAPGSEGFGSQLARKSITDQLGGEITYDWQQEGLRITIILPLDQLAP